MKTMPKATNLDLDDEVDLTPEEIAATVDPRLVDVVEGRLDPKPNIRATLDERAKTHGDYSEHAAVTQMLKQIMRAAPKWGELEYHEQETLEMAAHKIGRILTGDPHFHDHWHDAAGYFTLSADRNLPK